MFKDMKFKTVKENVTCYFQLCIYSENINGLIK